MGEGECTSLSDSTRFGSDRLEIVSAVLLSVPTMVSLISHLLASAGRGALLVLGEISDP